MGRRNRGTKEELNTGNRVRRTRLQVHSESSTGGKRRDRPAQINRQDFRRLLIVLLQITYIIDILF